MDNQLRNVPVLFNVNNSVGPRGSCAVKNVFQLFEMIFYVLADAGRNFNVTASILKPHGCCSLLNPQK
jgi:hypothetical protein